MDSLRPEPSHADRNHRRAGLMAVGEILFLLVVVTLLLWAVTFFMTAVSHDLRFEKTSADACSERGVYGMVLNRAEDQMWVFRPREGIVRLELPTGEVEESLPSAGLDMTAIAHSRDCTTTVQCNLDGTIARYRDNEETLIAEVALPREMRMNAAVSDDGLVVLCVTSGGVVHGWYGHGAVAREFHYDMRSESPVIKIGLNPAGDRLYLARFDGTVSFHNSVTGAACGNPLNAGEKCLSFDWSEDETVFGVINAFGMLLLYEIPSGQLRLGHAMDVPYPACIMASIKISPDSRRLALATNVDMDIRIVDLATGKLLGSLRGHSGIVRPLQFSADSLRLYSASYDGTIREWSLDTWQQLRMIN